MLAAQIAGGGTPGLLVFLGQRILLAQVACQGRYERADRAEVTAGVATGSLRPEVVNFAEASVIGLRVEQEPPAARAPTGPDLGVGGIVIHLIESRWIRPARRSGLPVRPVVAWMHGNEEPLSRPRGPAVGCRWP